MRFRFYSDMKFRVASLLTACLPLLHASDSSGQTPLRSTYVSIVGNQFFINGKPTYEGRTWNGNKIEGLLFNARMVQGVFDDLNSETVSRWAYPDTGSWDADRNTREFIAAMPEWRRHGLLAFTINLQGGSPQGYSKSQPWHNSAFDADGSLRPAYMDRLGRILERADQLGMAVILGYFYFGQDERLADEAAVIRATDNATRWVLNQGFRNVLVEICNETNDQSYGHEILQTTRIHELLEFVRGTSVGGRRLLAGVSYWGNVVPLPNAVRHSDFVLLHGNGVHQPDGIVDLVRKTRAVSGYRGQPIVFNEDDHFDFDKPMNNLVAAISEYASWGYFDYRMDGEDFDEGYQSVPTNWAISSDRKRGFFELLSEITGAGSNSSGAKPGVVSRPVGSARGNVSIREEPYRGWQNSITIDNGLAEVVIVPEIGRVMQFRFIGRKGPFWENESMLGKEPNPNSDEWGNFGGDKTWPAPQSEWPEIAPRSWPPPIAFDSLPVTAQIRKDYVTLISPVDPHFGIRTYRMIRLDPTKAEMKITTRYEKVTGKPVRVSVWIITQLNDPEGVFIPVPDPTLFPKGYHAMSNDLPPDLAYKDGLISLTRPKDMATKIGTDAGTLLWVGKETMLRIDSPRDSSRRYPDNSSSAEVYTNADPNQYVELEMLSPLQLLEIGNRMEASCTYTLKTRTMPDPEEEARKELKRTRR